MIFIKATLAIHKICPIIKKTKHDVGKVIEYNEKGNNKHAMIGNCCSSLTGDVHKSNIGYTKTISSLIVFKSSHEFPPYGS